MKYLGLNLTKEAKDLNAKNYKALLKETNINKWKHTQCSRTERLNIVKNVCITQSDLQIQYNPYQNPNGIFCRNRKKLS